MGIGMIHLSMGKFPPITIIVGTCNSSSIAGVIAVVVVSYEKPLSHGTLQVSSDYYNTTVS